MRVKKLQKKLRKIDGLLVSDPHNLNYLAQTTLFSESNRGGFLLVTKKSSCLFVSQLVLANFNPLSKILPCTQILPLKKPTDLLKFLNKSLKTSLLSQRPRVSHTRILFGIEENNLKYSEFKKLSEKLSLKSKNKLKVQLVPTKNIIENLRIIKDSQEIQKIKKACQITKDALDYIKNQLRADRTEKQIAWLIEKFLRQKGADCLAFPVIVASGPNSAIPHHQTNNRKLQKKDIVLIDAGCKYQGYCSDITRTFFIGKPKPEWKKVYSIVKSTHQKAINQFDNLTIKQYNNSLKASQLDIIARNYIKSKGYEKQFIHNLGHGLGLDIHEKPYISQKSQQTIKPGMVFTIEPGIYLPGKFGVRIEDTIIL